MWINEKNESFNAYGILAVQTIKYFTSIVFSISLIYHLLQFGVLRRRIPSELSVERRLTVSVQVWRLRCWCNVGIDYVVYPTIFRIRYWNPAVRQGVLTSIPVRSLDIFKSKQNKNNFIFGFGSLYKTPRFCRGSLNPVVAYMCNQLSAIASVCSIILLC